MKAIISQLIPAFAVIAGIFITGLVNRWQRREQFLGVLFNKKLESYALLCTETAKMTSYFLNSKDPEEIKHELSKMLPILESMAMVNQGSEMEAILFKGNLVASPRITEIVEGFIQIMQLDLSFDEKHENLKAFHDALRSQCRAEIGLDRLERHLKKMK